MKKDLLEYMAGLCQAASAALLVSAVIVPTSRPDALLGCYIMAIAGAFAIFFKNKEV
ncbi:MAG: hypothetical protein IJU76_03360 [Desulfovibrionaceae bacterium]|nr:hypothetical protein [Desulfovibrionaceae bacterium]